MSTPRAQRPRSLGIALLWLAVACTAIAALMAATGGFITHIGGVRVSMRTVARPVFAALVFGAGAFLMLGRDAASHQLETLSRGIPRRSPLLAVAFAAVIGLATFVNGAHIAGGTDSSGYLSQARLWRSGSLSVRTPLADELRLANGQYAFTPAGYQPAGPGAAVPAYPPGLPLMLAVAGERAQFAVVPLCAAGVVVLAFAIGRRIGGTDTALIAAAAAGASPILLFQAVQPMSDVPATFWWTFATWLLLVESPLWALGAGVAAACACFVRPNLFALTPLLGLLTLWWYGWTRTSLARTILLALPIGTAAAVFVYLQQTLYGGATTTGYGPVDSLFSLSHVAPNAGRYAQWAIHVQSGLLVIGLIAPLLIRRGRLTPSIDRQRAVRVAWSAWVLFAALQVFYLLYLVFDDWVYFRFLLPALPLVLVLQAATLAAVTHVTPPALRHVLVVVLAILVASWGVGRARGLGAFRLQDSEHRYLDVAEFTRSLPPDAVFVTLQYSGSLWHYRGAPILRWDWIDAPEIDAAIDALRARGRHIYVVVDDWELPRLRERYAGTRFLTRLRSPIFESGVPGEITGQVYDVTGMSTTGGAATVSWRPPPALRSLHTPAARDRAAGSASAIRSVPAEAARSFAAHR